MKNLSLVAGGHPITNDDFLWLQSQFKEVSNDLLCLLASPNGGNRLIAGGDVTTISPTVHSITGGWVAWGGELVRFEPAVLTGTGFIVLTRAASNIAPSKIYHSGATVWPYQETVGTLQLTASLGNPALFYLESALRFGVGSWTTATLIAPDWSIFTPSPALYHAPAFRRLATGEVELRGHIRVNDAGALPTAFVLPEGACPSRLQSFPRNFSNNAGLFTGCWAEVYPNGEVNLNGVTMTVGYHLSLDGIRFDVRS